MDKSAFILEIRMSNKGQRKTIFQTALTDNDSTDIEGVGTLREVGGKVYMYVQYDNGTGNLTPAAKDFVGLKSITYNTDGSIATLVVSDDMSDCKWGQGQLQAALTDQYYGWIQVKGLSQAFTVDATGSPSAGNALKMSATDTAMAVMAAVTDVCCGYLYDATSSANIAMLDCPIPGI